LHEASSNPKTSIGALFSENALKNCGIPDSNSTMDSMDTLKSIYDKSIKYCGNPDLVRRILWGLKSFGVALKCAYGYVYK